jgi:hypothetical protein
MFSSCVVNWDIVRENKEKGEETRKRKRKRKRMRPESVVASILLGCKTPAKLHRAA